VRRARTSFRPCMINARPMRLMKAQSKMLFMFKSTQTHPWRRRLAVMPRLLWSQGSMNLRASAPKAVGPDAHHPFIVMAPEGVQSSVAPWLSDRARLVS
jgi:hypothetical protein